MSHHLLRSSVLGRHTHTHAHTCTQSWAHAHAHGQTRNPRGRASYCTCLVVVFSNTPTAHTRGRRCCSLTLSAWRMRAAAIVVLDHTGRAGGGAVLAGALRDHGRVRQRHITCCVLQCWIDTHAHTHTDTHARRRGARTREPGSVSRERTRTGVQARAWPDARRARRQGACHLELSSVRCAALDCSASAESPGRESTAVQPGAGWSGGSTHSERTVKNLNRGSTKKRGGGTRRVGGLRCGG